jgi:(2R)-sulfolactate sulfo-lyase subunit alpha
VEDNVGVATKDIKSEEVVIGVCLEKNEEIKLLSNHDISLGHKIAIEDVEVGDNIIEYDEIIGVATNNIKKGDWVHIHNIKSARW